MKTPQPQPDWLYNITYGLSEGRKTRVLIDGTRFAVVQTPGGKWYDNSGEHLGYVCYYLVDKQTNLRKAHGLLDCRELQRGGRAKTAKWKKLVGGLDRNPWRVSESFDDLEAW
jgi:hypothetical protein